MTKADQQAFDTVKKLFRNDNGDPFEMTAGQIDLFRAIYEKQHPRTQFECYTQYGKSDTVSMAVLLRATTFPEKWIILGGSKEKARIIMSKLIKHIFENEYTLGKLQLAEGESLERLKHEKSKDRITFAVDDAGNLGEVIILSAETNRKGEDAGDILIGHGGKNLIADDAALIPNNIFGKAMRMLGGHKDNFLLKITNTLGRNHAYRSSAIEEYDKDHLPRPAKYMSDEGFSVIKIDWQQGVAEGRLTPEYVEEMRKAFDPIMFGAMYDCVYPPSDMVDEQGWMPLITEDELKQAQLRIVEPFGAKRLGADIAEGINFNAFVLRHDNYAKILDKTLERNTMKTADTIADFTRKEGIYGSNVFVDGTGIGAGVAHRLMQMNISANQVKVGERAPMKDRNDPTPIEYANMKAFLFWQLKMWLRQGGALEPHTDWAQLLKMRYREGHGGKIEIMPKERMRLIGLLSMSESTDIPDALALTFAKPAYDPFVPAAQQSQPREPYYPDLGI
jgi:hypothetical protein